MIDCPFCRMIAGASDSGDILLETAGALVALSDWSTKGHAVVIARRHVENLSDLSESEAIEFIRAFRLAEKTLLTETATERSIIMKLGIQVPHLHLHIYPVSRDLERAAVFDILEMRVEDRSDAVERRAFVKKTKGRLATALGKD